MTSSFKTVSVLAREAWKIISRAKNALVFCALVYLAAPISLIYWAITHRSIVLAVLLIAAYFLYAMFVGPKVEHPIQMGLRLHDTHGRWLAIVNVALLVMVAWCIPELAHAVRWVWVGFPLALLGLL